MKIDKITMNDASIDFDTATIEKIVDDEVLMVNYSPPTGLKVILTGEKLPEQVLKAFNSNQLIDIIWFVKKDIYNCMFFISSYSIDSLHRYELTLISSGVINECY